MPCAGVVQGLSWVDRLLVVWILGAMIIGVVCGKFAPVLRDRFAVAELYGTPLPIAVGLWLMMWPVLSKVRGTSVNMLPCTARTPDEACPVSALPQRASLGACMCIGEQVERQAWTPPHAGHRSLQRN